MPSDQNTKPSSTLTGSGSDDGQGNNDKNSVPYPSEDEINKQYGGEERFMQAAVPKGSLKDEEDRHELEVTRRGEMEAEFVERALTTVKGLAEDK